jgi:hypothetical protein
MLQKLILLATSCRCKARTTVTLYSKILSSFIAKAVDNLRCQSLVQEISTIYVVYSNLAPVLSSFPLVTTQRILAGFLSRSDPVDPTLFIRSWLHPCLGTVILRNPKQNLLRHFQSKPHFTQLIHCPVDNFSGSCCKCLSMSHGVPASLQRIAVAL